MNITEELELHKDPYAHLDEDEDNVLTIMEGNYLLDEFKTHDHKDATTHTETLDLDIANQDKGTHSETIEMSVDHPPKPVRESVPSPTDIDWKPIDKDDSNPYVMPVEGEIFDVTYAQNEPVDTFFAQNMPDGPDSRAAPPPEGDEDSTDFYQQLQEQANEHPLVI